MYCVALPRCYVIAYIIGDISEGVSLGLGGQNGGCGAGGTFLALRLRVL